MTTVMFIENLNSFPFIDDKIYKYFTGETGLACCPADCARAANGGEFSIAKRIGWKLDSQYSCIFKLRRDL